MTTKVANLADNGNYLPLEKYLSGNKSNEITVFSKLFQRHTPLELYQAFNDFQNNIPFNKGGELIGSLRFMVYSLSNDFLMIHGIITDTNIPIKIARSLEELISGLNNYTDALEAVKYFDYLIKIMLLEVAEYTQKECNILFDLKDAYLELYALNNEWDISPYLNLK